MKQGPEETTVLEERLLPDQAPVLEAGHSFGSITDKIAGIVLRRPVTLGWAIGLLIAFGGLNVLGLAITYLFFRGTGIWGINIPVGWGFAIINFVWWIGIGHAGTLISAILLLFKQSWRNSINRFAEAMTLFAVACAGMFPLIHTGRPWLAVYWLFPYPNSMNVWPQFRSPLIWDVFAVTERSRCCSGSSVLFLTSARCATRPRVHGRRECTVCSRWVGVALPATGSGTNRLTCCWPV